MPTYEFKCSANADHLYKEIRSITEPQRETECQEPGCPGKLIRIFGTPPITFNGGGFSARRG